MNLLMERSFVIFGVAHSLAMLVTLLLAVGLTRYARAHKCPDNYRLLRFVMGGLLVLAVLLDPVLTLVRYGVGAYGWGMVKDNSLPFFLCDVVALLLAWALFTKSQRLAEIGYLWGLAGTVQGLIMPTLWFGPKTWEFYAFFLEHGGVPIAAVFLVWGMRIIPEKGAFRRAVIWSVSYVGIVMLLNVAMGENYGFLNGKPDAETFFDYMGPWPYYLVTLHVVAFALYGLLLWIAPKRA